MEGAEGVAGVVAGVAPGVVAGGAGVAAGAAGLPVSASRACGLKSAESSAARMSEASGVLLVFRPAFSRTGMVSPARVSGRTRETWEQALPSWWPAPASSAGWPPLTG